MKFALITPSFAPDFERCQLLARSVERFVAPGTEHHIIVDARDETLFRTLAGPRTRIRTVESIVPWWLRRMPGASRWWLSLRTLPVRNWILQQMVKLSVGATIDADAYVFVDSDVTFVRPFDAATLQNGELTRLFRVPGAANLPGHRRWHRSAAKLLGLPPRDYFGSTYIGNLVTWRRDHLQELYARLERVSGASWQRAVCGQWHLSEYILYGVFVEHMLNDRSRHWHSDVPLCHISWDYDLASDSDVAGFVREIAPHHVAVMISAKQRIEPRRYERLLAAVA